MPNAKTDDGHAKGIENFTPQEADDIAASFQEAMTDILTIKMKRAANITGAKTLILGGGVAANSGLREKSQKLADKIGCTLRRPPMKYCTDSAAMIAGLGYHLLVSGQTSDLRLAATPTVRM